MIVGITTGCQKYYSASSKPTFLAVEKISQDKWDKERNVVQYKLQTWISTGISETHWYTLQEGFQIGDTLILVKK